MYIISYINNVIHKYIIVMHKYIILYINISYHIIYDNNTTIITYYYDIDHTPYLPEYMT